MSAAVGQAGFTGSEITDWCATCQDYAVPMRDGTCGFCGHELGAPIVLGPVTELGAAPEPPPRLPLNGRRKKHVLTKRQREPLQPLRDGDAGFGTVCECGGPKSKQAHRCMACADATGTRGGRGTPRPAMRGPYGVTDEQMEEARRLYVDEQISLREVARRIFDQTYGYSTVRSLGEALYRGFRNRGWRLRSQSDATRLRNWKHGLKPRAQTNEEQNAYRHWLAQQRGWNAVQGPGQPTCKGHKTTSPGKGKPCTREAMAGSEYCYSHDPEKAAEREAHLVGARAKVAGGDVDEQARILERARANAVVARKAQAAAARGDAA